MKNKKPSIGGQAVIEGVMIRGLDNYAVAIRKNGKIITKKWNIPKKKYPFLKFPLIRGFVNLAEMMTIGTKSLVWSAQEAGGEGEKIGKNLIAFTFLISAAAVILFFIALPYFLTNLAGLTEDKKPFLFNIADGIIRIFFLN